MYFKVFRAQSWGKKAGQDKTGVFGGALQFGELICKAGDHTSSPINTQFVDRFNLP